MNPTGRVAEAWVYTCMYQRAGAGGSKSYGRNMEISKVYALPWVCWGYSLLWWCVVAGELGSRQQGSLKPVAASLACWKSSPHFA